MSNPTDTNQASEDELEKEVRKYFYLTGYNDTVNTAVQEAVERLKALIRTEKLKLLAEVRERVVGENDSQPGNPAPDLVEHNRLVRDGLRFEQRTALNKLEAEL